MNIRGKLIEKFETASITETFKKREFVIEYAENPMYPEFVKFELIQDRCDLIEPFSLGDEVEVDFNLKGRKWTDKEGGTKYFNSLQAWKIAPVQDMAPAPPPPSASSPAQESAPPSAEPEWLKSSSSGSGSANFEDDDLPF